MSIPIMSRSVFDQMDKNKDGLVSKGELRLAQKGFNLKDLAEILQVGISIYLFLQNLDTSRVFVCRKLIMMVMENLLLTKFDQL